MVLVDVHSNYTDCKENVSFILTPEKAAIQLLKNSVLVALVQILNRTMCQEVFRSGNLIAFN